jgi:capsular exopolysaccharide synthesis family protein
MTDNTEIRKNAVQEIDYQKLTKIILSRWYWVAATVILSLCFAYAYLWYTPKTYSTSATLKYDDAQSNLNSLVDLGLNKGQQVNKIQSESIVIRSANVISEATELIDWKVSYFLKGRVRTTDLYPNKPFYINITEQDSISFYDQPINLILENNNSSFKIEYQYGGKLNIISSKFNQTLVLPGIKFNIKKLSFIDPEAEYSFKFNHIYEFYGKVAAGLNIVEISKYSSIANLSKSGDNPYFAADALNAIIKVYLEQDLISKTQSAKQIITFIDEQMKVLSENVQLYGEKLKKYKQNNNIVDLTTASSTVLGEVATSELKSKMITTQLEELERLKIQLQSGIQTSSLNFKLFGTLDPLFSEILDQWNTNIQKRISLLKTYNETSQPIKDIDKNLSVLRKAALDNMTSSMANLKLQKESNKQTLVTAYDKLNNLPQQERRLFDLQRDYDINEKIYRYLAEKKLEAQIGRSSVIADASIVDIALPNLSPIAPNVKSIWQSAWILGIGAGIGLIFLVRMFNPYIYDKETIESLTNTPIIGLIRHYPHDVDPNKNEILSMAQPKSLFAESVRSVRTNLSFIASDKKSKVVSITSEISGEGKSFVSLNLASSLALINKKVIFIAADLRRSKIQFNLKDNAEGLSEYLANQTDLASIINKSEQENLDVIISGKVPPNPAELMYGDRLNAMIAELRTKYDFILFDTAPIGLVSDALPLIRVSDVNLFVIRTGKSKNSAATIPDRIANEYHLNNTFIVLNDFRVEHIYSRYYSTNYNNSNNYYGYYYIASDKDGGGYYTRDKKKPWWKKTFQKLKKKD